MNTKNDTLVNINGKNYNIAGYEDVEYLQKIALYLNQKHNELKTQLGHNIINESDRNILMQINIADDYLKLKNKQIEYTDDADDRQKEIAALHRDLVAVQTKLETNEREGKMLRDENVELQKKIVRLETELKKSKVN